MRNRFLKPGQELKILENEVGERVADGSDSNVLATLDNQSTYNSVEQQRRNLPIYQWRSNFLYALQSNRVIIITGETGSGKSTQIPQYIYEAGWLQANVALLAVTQPRRIAVISVATRIAEEKDWKLGEQIGYSIRFERYINQESVVHFYTDGMLIQEMLRDPLLSSYRVIMLDEVHERSLQTDVLIGLLKKVLARRPFDFRLIISSATLETENFFDYFSNINYKTDEDTSSLGDVIQLSVEGRLFPVKIFYSNESIPCYIKASLNLIFNIHEEKPPGGDILVFLTGQEEVNRLISMIIEEYRNRKEKLGSFKSNHAGKNSNSGYLPLRVIPFYGALSHQEQMRAFSRTVKYCRKVIVATNLAEASVTIPGIVYVIDCGYARMRAYNPNNDLEMLVTLPVSKAAAKQRAGRAGRMRMGEAYRLYTEESYQKMLPLHSAPECIRSDLSSVLLRLKTLGIDKIASFDWLPPVPPLDHLGKAAERLVALEALESTKGHLTIPKGLQMAELLAACGFSDPGSVAALLASSEEGCTRETAIVLALMQLQHVFHAADSGRVRTSDKDRRQFFGCKEGDHLTILNVFLAYEKLLQDPSSTSKSVENWCDARSVNGRALAHARQLLGRIETICRRSKILWIECKPQGDPDPVRRSLLKGFFTHVARLAPSKDHYLSIRGDHPLKVHPTSIYYASLDQLPDYILFTRAFLSETISDRPFRSHLQSSIKGTTWIGEISAIRPEWLTELIPHYFIFGTDREHLENALVTNKS